MDKLRDSYDVIVLGTGLKEHLIGSLLALNGNQVLLISATKGYDSTETIDADTRSKVLEDFKKYEPVRDMDGIEKDKTQNIFPEFLKKSNDLYKDFKDIRKVVERTGLLRLLEIDHTIVIGNVYRVQIKHFIPTDADELLASGLMGVLEKRRFIAFRDYCVEYRQDVERTHKNFNALDDKNSSIELYKDFGFDPYGQEYCGQAIARFSDERYIERRSYELIRRVQLCHNNLAGNAIAPFFLPLYRIAVKKTGSGQSSSSDDLKLLEEIRSIIGENGTNVLDHSPELGKLEVVQASEGNVTPKVKIGDKEITCKLVICHPEYATSLCEEVGKVARQVFLCKKFDLIREYQCCHWRVPFRQMRKYNNKKSDVCITFLGPQVLLSKKYVDEEQPSTSQSSAKMSSRTSPLSAEQFLNTCTKGKESLYVCMVETMDDTKANEAEAAKQKSSTSKEKPSTSKEKPSTSKEEPSTSKEKPSTYPPSKDALIDIQTVEEKLDDGLHWAHLTDGESEIITKRFNVVKSTLWKPKMDLYKPEYNQGYHFHNTKVLVTDYSEMTIPFEMICGEASDIMKAIAKSNIDIKVTSNTEFDEISTN